MLDDLHQHCMKLEIIYCYYGSLHSFEYFIMNAVVESDLSIGYTLKCRSQCDLHY